MRILLLGPANSIHLQRWAGALAGRGHALCVASQQRCERGLLPASAEVVWLPHGGSLGYFRNAWPLRRLLARWRPDVLSAHYASGYGTTMALSGFHPTLLSVWGSDVYDFPYESRFKGSLLRWNLRQATLLASTSHAMARQVQRLTPERVDIPVTPFGVDLARFAPAPDPDGSDKGCLTIGIVKLLTPKYGVDLLLRAFAGLRQDPDCLALGLDCRLLIVGDGPQRAELDALASQLGIAQCTEFAGAVAHAEVPTWLHRLDIYAAPSRLDSESFGVAVIEAGACGLPVVVSDAGGLPEVVRHGETGLVVPRDDVPALQAALKLLALDPALRRRLGREGRAHVARDYTWGHCVDLMEQCLARTLEMGTGAHG
jgi:glycosyltransferase involved in cell wall biosynthesis